MTVPASTKVGVYVLLACADDYGVVAESDEANDCRAAATQVEVRAPNLKETAVADPPATVGRGGVFVVTDTVANQGNAGAGVSTTRFYLSADTKGSKTDTLLGGSRGVPALGVGAVSSGTVAVTVPGTAPTGEFYLLACADDVKKVAESNEKDNCRAAPSRVMITP